MANRDSAFLWETEVLRSSRRPTTRPGPGDEHITDAVDWLTIREASETTGVPASTIRKWARHENIPSYLEKTEDGYLRIVSMRGITRWANEIGRDVEGLTEVEPGAGPAETSAQAEEVDLTEAEEAPTAPEIPEGTMLVPLDAWNKMLNQLGNLHEAGQQLAEARERAAKAETEAQFLRERLRELRAEAVEKARIEDEKSASLEEAPTQTTKSLVRKIYSDWRSRRRR